MARSVGDETRLREMRDHLREQRYHNVLTLFTQLRFPDRLTPAERRMVEIAQRKMSNRGHRQDLDVPVHVPRSARTRGAPAAITLDGRRCHAPRRRSLSRRPGSSPASVVRGSA
jgi:hypothetical protein